MTIRAGTAVRDITPSGNPNLFGYPGSGRAAEGVHDRLLASALHLRSETISVILVSLDLLWLDPATAKSIRSAISAQTGVNEGQIFMCCSHTHSGPVTTKLLAWSGNKTVGEPDAAYLDRVKETAAAAAAHASATTRPVEISWTTADASRLEGITIPGESSIDTEIEILGVREPGGGPYVAVTVVSGISPMILNEESRQISSDYPHYERLYLQEHFGSEVVALHCSGSCAGQGGLNLVSPATFEGAERFGRGMGQLVAESLDALGGNTFTDSAALTVKVADVTFPARKLASRWDARVKWGESKSKYRSLQEHGGKPSEIRSAAHALAEAEGDLALIRAQNGGDIQKVLENYLPVEVQGVSIGSRMLLGLPGVVGADYGRRIRDDSGGKACVVNLVNGELQGDIVSAEAAAAGRFGFMNSLFGPEAGDELVRAALAVMK